MEQTKTYNMLRPLGIFERALVHYNSRSPFNVVSVLRLDNAPSPESVQQALHVLQNRHPLSRAGIVDGALVKLSNPYIQFEVFDAQHDAQWLEVVDQQLNTPLNSADGLLRGIYLRYSMSSRADLILTLHHVIMDAASGMSFLDELLQLCSGSDLPDEIQNEILPPVEERFPPTFKSPQGSIQTIKYAMAQMTEEMTYHWQMRGKRKPAFHENSRGFALFLTLPEALVDELSKICRAKKVTLNSLLNAAIVLAANRLLYGGERRPMQTFSFADLRPYTIPPTPANQLANYISMLRYIVTASGQEDVWKLTEVLHPKIYRSLKSGDKFTASKLSESLIKTYISLNSIRIGNTALNYGGAVPIKPAYENIKVLDVRGFLSSAYIGPEVATQARLFDNKLQIDFMFLETDMDRDKAEQIVGKVKAILEQAVFSPA